MMFKHFLEQNSELIPLPFMSNHHLHMNAVISKFKLGSEAVTDFAYLTKSSIQWYLVLIELERPNKFIFASNNGTIEFSSHFNKAMDQIRSWKIYVDGHKESLNKQIEKIKVPLAYNNLELRYVLIFGRRKEFENSEKRVKALAQKQLDEGVEIKTYDSLITFCQTNPQECIEKIILSPWREQGFSMKELPSGEIETALFAYIHHDFLKFDSQIEARLKEQGYQIDEWKKGKLLSVNNRSPYIDVSEDSVKKA